jgi:excisionase family DNA binding protein
VAETDLATWLPIADAAARIGCSTRTVERLGRAKQLEQRLRRQDGTPPVAVYNPDDVARVASERRPAPPPFVLPAVPGNGNSSERKRNTLLRTAPAADDPIRQFFTEALRYLQALHQSPPSPPVSATVAETLYVTVKEAAAILGLPQVDVRALIHDGELNCRMTRRGGIRIRRKDLEAL